MLPEYSKGFTDKVAASGLNLEALRHVWRRLSSPRDAKHPIRDRMTPLGAGLTGSQILAQLGAIPALKETEAVPTKDEAHMADVLKRFARRKGTKVVKFPEFLNAVRDNPKMNTMERVLHGMYGQPAVDQSRDKLIKQMEGSNLAAGLYAPDYKMLVAGGNNPNILSHELGHMLQPSTKVPGMMQLIRGPAQLGALAPLFTRDEHKANLLAAGGSAMALPMFGQELSASIRGGQLLKHFKGGRPIKAYSGLPSYAALMTAPWITKEVRKLMGGYDQ